MVQIITNKDTVVVYDNNIKIPLSNTKKILSKSAQLISMLKYY